MTEQKNTQELTGIKKYFKEQNIEISWNRIGIQALGGMAHGLFASLLIGTIINTVGTFIPGVVGEFLMSISGQTSAVQGAAMALAIGYAVTARHQNEQGGAAYGKALPQAAFKNFFIHRLIPRR